LYESGKGIDKDYVEALAWYRKSAAKGDASAMRAIGRLYRLGLGVSMDLAEAWAWHSVAARHFSAQEQQEAAMNQRELEFVDAILTAGQRKHAGTRAGEIEVLTRPAQAEPAKPPVRGETRT
ncbi:MAG: tetratricopeptide repeat protein, partial [Burkholderiales bacterium]